MTTHLTVGYDPAIFCAQRYGGISRYYCEVASRISKVDDVHVKIAAPLYINAYLHHLPDGLVVGFKRPNLKLAKRASRAMAMLIGGGILRAIEPDIVHETYYHPERVGSRRARRVLTIYDMIHEKFPSHFHPGDMTSRYKALAARRADHVIFISESTRRDAIEILGLSAEKTSVIYLGADLMGIGSSRFDAPLPPFDRPFLLFVGNRDGYKNFLMLVRALATSTQLRTEVRLICFGGGAFSREELETIKSCGLRTDQVIQLGGDDQVLANLYRHAAAFVYPSLYEGFGIPPLEAMSFGCPVVCSNSSSIPEVVGNAGEYFDPNDPESMRLAIERVLASDEIREDLRVKGRLRVSKFSWDRCAAETLQTYRMLI